MRKKGGRGGGAVDLRIDELKGVDDRISSIAEDDPLGALFIVKNLHLEGGLDEKPLVAKILLQIAEKLDASVRHGYVEKAKVYKSLLLKLVEELDVKSIYGRLTIPGAGGGEATFERDDLLEDVPLEESLAAVRSRAEPPASSE